MRRVSRLLRRITVAKDSEAPLVPVADLERRVKSFAHDVLVLLLGPEVLQLQQQPLRVVQRLHPRIAEPRELLGDRLVSPHVVQSVGHAVLDPGQHRQVVRRHNAQRVRGLILEGVHGLLQEVLALVVVLPYSQETGVTAAALREADRVTELLVPLASLREEGFRLGGKRSVLRNIVRDRQRSVEQVRLHHRAVARVEVPERLRHRFQDLEQQAHGVLDLLVLERKSNVPDEHLENRLATARVSSSWPSPCPATSTS